MGNEQEKAGNTALVPSRNSKGAVDSRMDTKGYPQALREQRRTWGLKMLKIPAGKFKNKGGNYLQITVTIKVLPSLLRDSSAQEQSQ